MGGVEDNQNRHRVIARASRAVLAGNLLLGAGKIAAGFIFGSLSILGDGLDSLGDVLATLTTLAALRVMSQPPDTDHPWGHERADTIAAKFITFFMFYFGAQLFTRAVTDMVQGAVPAIPQAPGMIVLVLSVVVKVMLALLLMRTGKKTSSAMLQANALNMRNDVVLSLSVLLGVGLAVWFQSGWIDTVTALLVSVWIMAGAVRGFSRTNLELMDGLREPEVYEKVFSAVDSVEGTHNPHRVRIRRFADRILIDLDVEMAEDLPLAKAHEIGCRVETEIKKALPEVYDIMLHLEPFGNKEEEKYGLTRSDL